MSAKPSCRARICCASSAHIGKWLAQATAPRSGPGPSSAACPPRCRERCAQLSAASQAQEQLQAQVRAQPALLQRASSHLQAQAFWYYLAAGSAFTLGIMAKVMYVVSRGCCLLFTAAF